MWPMSPMTARMASPWPAKARFDVLIVDRMMPRRDGLSMISELRGDGDKTPALVLVRAGRG
jgi:DNA-binding response OmpR family regulator